ncbi:TPA: hypothetical protein ACGVAS_004389 [Vibrio vulnificus]
MKLFMSSMFMIVLLAGCGTTSMLWEDDSYWESVSAFTINDNNNLLIVSGKEHAYVFDVAPELKEVLKLSRQIEFTPKLTDFYLNSVGEIVGELSLSIHSSTLSDADINDLSNLGFSQAEPMVFIYILSGNRYSLESNASYIKLDNEYRVRIVQESSAVTNVGRVVVTPATVVIDSALVATTVIPTAILYGVLGVYMYSAQP